MVDHIAQSLHLASLRNLCKAWKSIIKKWRPKKKSSPSASSSSSKDPHVHEVDLRFHHPDINNSYQVDIEDDNTQEQRETIMNGSVHSYMYNGTHEGMKSTSEPSVSPRAHHIFKHRSTDNGFSTSPASLSRNRSRRSKTPTRAAASLLRSISRNKSSSTTDHRSNSPIFPSPSSNDTNRSRKSTDSTTTSDRNPSLEKCVSRKNSTPNIMYSNSSGRKIKPPPVEKKLECTLVELCYGCMKKIKITRNVVTNSGEIVQEEEILTIKVKPGWKKGTKITFEGMGNEKPGSYPADVTFIIAEKRHHLFRREGDELELAVEIPLLQALTGHTITIPLLGGDCMSLTLDDIIFPGYQKIISSQGMPNTKDHGKRGNLKITFHVEFPTNLTDQQRADVLDILQGS